MRTLAPYQVVEVDDFAQWQWEIAKCLERDILNAMDKGSEDPVLVDHVGHRLGIIRKACMRQGTPFSRLNPRLRIALAAAVGHLRKCRYQVNLHGTDENTWIQDSR